MSALHWEVAGTRGPGDPESHYVEWAITRPDCAPGRKPRGVLRIGPALAEAVGEGDSQPGRVTRALREQLKEWGLELPCDLLPAHTLRPDLRSYGAAKPSPGTPDPLGDPLRKGSVFVGVIDDAIGLANERFRDRDGNTRVDYFWNQGGCHVGGDVPFGREFHRPEIDGIFKACRGGPSAGDLDEEAVYRRMDLVDMARRELQREAMRLSHGTAVLDIAAGERPSAVMGLSHATAVPDLAARERPEAAFQLALVSMPQQVTQDTSGTFAAPFAISGILRILEHVDRRRIEDGRNGKNDVRKYPVVINLSFGLTAGSKDGQGVVERFLDLASDIWGSDYGELRFVVSAGNHRLARTHATLSDPLDESAHPLFWRLLPDDRTASFVEIWGKQRSKPDGDQASFSIAIQPPGFKKPVRLERPQFGYFYDLRAADGRLMIRAWFNWRTRSGTKGRESVTLAMPPTAPDEDGAQPVSPGDWRILVEPTGEDVGAWPINLFIHRDDSLPGYVSKGRQSRFHDDRYRVRDDSGRLQLSDEPPDCHVRRSGTLSTFGYSAAAVVVGGCHWDGLARGKPARGRVVDYSGEDFPPVPQVAQRPDLTAPSEESRVRHGVTAAGTRSGSKIRLGGTSVAAPAVARELAKQLMKKQEGKLRAPPKDPDEPGEESKLRAKLLWIELEEAALDASKAFLPDLRSRRG